MIPIGSRIFIFLIGRFCEKIPYFMKQSAQEESIYNISSTMKRNRTIIFQDHIGVSRSTLVKWIRKLDSSYLDFGKDYYRIVVDYLNLIKIE